MVRVKFTKQLCHLYSLDSYTNCVRWANYVSYVCKFPAVYNAKNYENWLAVDKVIAKISKLTFLAHPVHTKTDA